MNEIGDAYRGVRLRVNALVVDTDDVALDTIAPATPEWRVRDLLAHLAGVTADIVSGNLEGVGTDEWTARHVEQRRDRSIDELMAEWNERAPTVEAMTGEFGRAAGQLLSDATTHEHDIRGALGVPGARDSDAVALSFESGGTSLGIELDRAGIGAICVHHDEMTSTFGAADPIATLRTTRFEFVRALTGRRSRDQIAAYDWDGVMEPEHLVLGLFSVRPVALVE
jgi:uncharacterized protein (TIGR03083 family)